ncbi:hypothetical protein CFOL_v3_26760 [Cephalotus follicularis]|uniref:Uncharacterized protein n=1 Tax=Cephalotus follicularis TaxID=3775 RepID=A0A1Q3CT16_CEPFO|nr:hypothetical protein CFOL_v3_26760 [Cephalotus follicularis]
MEPPSLHSNFFSSLKQVEKRLKLEHRPQQDSNLSQKNVPQATPDCNYASQESLSSPIYLDFDQPNSNSTLQESSEPPLAFLSCSPQFPTIQQNPPQTTEIHGIKDIDDIELLIEMLGLSDCYKQQNHEEEEEEEEEEEKERGGVGGGKCGNKCECEGGFYEKIVGVKGPKCEKEVERMEGWIKYFMGGDDNGERREPLRLALLLLGKAAFASGGGDFSLGVVDFPSTIEEFFKIDPPKD